MQKRTHMRCVYVHVTVLFIGRFTTLQHTTRLKVGTGKLCGVRCDDEDADEDPDDTINSSSTCRRRVAVYAGQS